MSEPPWRWQTFAALTSTQDLCRRLAESGEPGRLAIRADRQTAGRGTRGRGWESPPGNLALSVLLRPALPAALAGQWALLAAVALAETVAAFLSPAGMLSLKWPNDLLLDGRKLAGILTESAAGAGGRLDWLVIGFGVNLAVAPTLAERPTASLAEQAAPPPPDTFAMLLLGCLDRWAETWHAHGLAPIRAAWLRHAPAPGSALTLRLGGRSIDGRFAGLAPDGALLLSADGQTRAFAAGEC